MMRVSVGRATAGYVAKTALMMSQDVGVFIPFGFWL
jgi:hypothetical protein